MYKEQEFSSETAEFIRAHRKDDVRALALQAHKYPTVNMNEAVTQIAGWQIADKKVPLFARTEGVRYPKHLSMEQCSSEITARYKASLVEGDSFADLTAGFGVDCAFIAQKFRTAEYVERQEELCMLAKHNFPLLGLSHINVHHDDGISYLKKMNRVDCLFLDPARRDSHGGKTVALADCEPNICKLESLLLKKAKRVLIKLSPMLDISSALNDVKSIRQLHIIAVNNECKELVAILESTEEEIATSADRVVITCSQLVENSIKHRFTFQQAEETHAVCKYTDRVKDYLYEPGASLLKAGPYKLLSERYEAEKLHPNSHLYTSEHLLEFPGRCFRVDAVSGFGKKDLKAFLQDTPKGNLTVRNFPMSVADLRKKLKLKEGGDVYLFATTLNNGEKVLIKCHKA